MPRFWFVTEVGTATDGLQRTMGHPARSPCRASLHAYHLAAAYRSATFFQLTTDQTFLR